MTKTEESMRKTEEGMRKTEEGVRKTEEGTEEQEKQPGKLGGPVVHLGRVKEQAETKESTV